MMGRYLKDLNLFTLSDLEHGLNHYFGEEKKDLIPLNLQAYQLGYGQE